jgi:hypothetical protein
VSFLAIPLIFLIILLPGLAGWLAFANGAKVKLTGLECVFIWLLAGTAVVSWLSLTLAAFTIFSLPLLLTVVLIPSVLMIGWAGWHGRFQRAFSGLTWSWHDGAVGLLLLLAVFLSGRPSEYIIGGRDHGVYVNTGIHIAKTGGILVQDKEIVAVPAELRATLVWPETRTYQAGFPGPWSEGQRLAGLTIRDLDAGAYLPHAFHLYPALIALFFAVGGVPTALFTTMFLALLGSLAIYATTARLWGQALGLLTLLLLTFSTTQVWFTGYPTAEIMVQVFFWGGLFALILLLENEGRYTAVLAGSCLGLLHLAKLDTVLVPLTVGVLFLILWLRRQFRPGYWWGIAVYFALSLQAIIHASLFATTYFLDHAIRNLLPGFVANRLVIASDGYPNPTDWVGRFVTANWPMLLVAGVIILASLALLHWVRPALQRPLARLFQQPHYWQQAIAGMILLFVLGTVVSDQFFTIPATAKTMQAVHLSRLYLTRAGLLIGSVGWLLLFFQANSTSKFVALFLLAGNIAPLYILGAGTSLDHFWVVRRFIPIAFPAFLLAMAGAIGFVWSYKPTNWLPKRWLPINWQPIAWLTQAVAVGLVLLILAGFLQHVRFIAGVVEYEGLTEQLTALASQLPDEAILLIQNGTPTQQFSLPLWFLFDKTVFSIRAEVKAAVLLETAVAHWQHSGKSVYWLATDKTPPPVWPNWEQQHQFSYLIDLPRMETPRDRIPHDLEQLQQQIDVYRLIAP